MSLKKDIIGAEVQIGSSEAQKSLVDLQQKTSSLANENDRLRISQAKLKALGKENTEEYKKITKAISDNSKSVKDNQAQMDALRKTLGVTEMSTKQLAKRAQELRRELSGMNQGADPERFNQLNKELIETERQMKKNKAAIGETKEAVNPLVESAKGLLPAFGWSAIAAGAVAAFNKIKNSTDAMATDWEIFMGGMNRATDEFFRTIATGDWSNFMDRMKEAIEVGREYASTLDDLEEKTRALRIIEAEARAKELELELKLRDKTLSDEERIAAGNERIKLEEDLAAKRTKIAQDAFDNEMKITMLESRLTKEQVEKVMKDFDSMDKEQAKNYLDMINNRNQLTQTMMMEGSTDYDLKKMEKLNAEIAAAPESIRLYAEAVKGQGKTTDDQLNKTTDAWVNLLEAQNSAVENTKKVRIQVKSLLAGDSNGDNKDADVAAKRAKALSDFLSKTATEQQDAINKYFHDAGEGAFDEFMKAIEERQKSKTIDISVVPGLSEEKEKEDPALNYAMEQFKETPDWLALQRKAGLIGEQEYQDKLLEITKKAEDKKAKLAEDRMQNTQELASLGANFVSAMMDFELEKAGDNEEKKAAIRKKYANIQFLTTASQIVVDTAAGIMKAIDQLGPIAGPIAAAIIGATGAVQLGIANAERKKMMGSKKSGGFSNVGDDDEIDGYYHKNEFVASAPAVRNPSVKRVLDVIDLAQKQGTVSTLNLSAVVASGGMKSGGYASSSPEIDTSKLVGAGAWQNITTDKMQNEVIKQLAEAVKELRQWKPSIDIETYEKKRTSYDKTVNSGLK